MRQRLLTRLALVAAVTLTGAEALATNAGRGASPPAKPSQTRDRNLLVYDAFWENIEKNHYDPQMLSRAEVRALRDQGRLQAAAVEAPTDLYDQVFGGIARALPESRVIARQPRLATPPLGDEIGVSSRDEGSRLAALLAGGPGFDETTLRRGSRNLRVVTEVAHGSPAEEAGIRPGWRVLSYSSIPDPRTNTVQFKGEFVALDTSTALAWEQGKLPDAAPDPASVVKISYAHRPLPTRQPFESRRVGKGVHYVRFDDFGDDESMHPVFDALAHAGSRGLIIDLRWNPGGLTQQAQKVAGALLGDGVTLGFHRKARGYEEVRTAKVQRRYEGPLVLLIGPRSGRCSEMLAAAVRDHRRGKLVGRMTNGSALTAELFPLPDGGLMSVPTSELLSPAYRKLQGVGVAPDVRVLPTLEEIRASRDPTLDRAVQVLSAGGGGYSEELPARFRTRPGELFPPI